MTTAMQYLVLHSCCHFRVPKTKSVPKFKNLNTSLIQNPKSNKKAVTIQLQKCKNTRQSAEKLSSNQSSVPLVLWF